MKINKSIKIALAVVLCLAMLDITSQCYSGGTVYIKQLSYTEYDKVKIIAKAVYNTKNFRWQLDKENNTFVSCTADGTDYNIVGSLTTNKLNLANGSYSGSACVLCR